MCEEDQEEVISHDRDNGRGLGTLKGGLADLEVPLLCICIRRTDVDDFFFSIFFCRFVSILFPYFVPN